MRNLKLFLFLVIILLVFILIYIQSIFNLESNCLQECIAKLYEYEVREKERNKNFKETLFSNGSYIPNIELLDPNNNLIEMSKIITRNTLIFRFSEISCTPCVENGIKILNQLNNTISNREVILLSDFSSSKRMRIFSQIHNIKVPFYSYPNKLNNLLIDLDTTEFIPYFFILETNLKVNFTYASSSKDNIKDDYFIRVSKYLDDEKYQHHQDGWK